MTPSGFIALQVHGVGNRKDPLEVRWRNLRIKVLEEKEGAGKVEGAGTDAGKGAGKE